MSLRSHRLWCSSHASSRSKSAMCRRLPSGLLNLRELTLAAPKEDRFPVFDRVDGPLSTYQRIGSRNQFEVIGRVGGTPSAVWLVKDLEISRFLAMKVLTRPCTYGVDVTDSKGISSASDTINFWHGFPEAKQEHGHEQFTPLAEHFSTPRQESDDGKERLYTLVEVGGPYTYTLRTLLETSGGRLPMRLTKKVVHQLCLALDYLHNCRNAIHTAIDSTNVLLSFDELDIRDTRGDSIATENFGIKLADFGQALLLNQRRVHYLARLSMCAPEMFLGISWDEKIDIWALGCLILELLTGERLLLKSSDVTHHLALNRMDRVPLRMVVKAVCRDHCLEPDGTPLDWSECGQRETPKSVVELVENDALMNAGKERNLAVSFIEHCLMLDSDLRPSVDELLCHSWLRDVHHPRTVG